MDMDDPLFSSPGSSSASDSDAYNTETARVYFGPLKTPERKFVAASKHLFPPANDTPLRRSPRLSSPRARSVTPADTRQAQEDLEDMKQVDELVNLEDSEDDDVPDSVPDTPPNVQVVPDEPSSALAERIMHALDNPSPPPSPPPTLSLFDPYHAMAPEASTDYQADLMSLNINDSTEQDSANPMPIFSLAPLPATFLPSDPSPQLPVASAAEQQDLISFDSFSTPPHSEILTNGTGPPMTLSVDDLLSQSPGALNFDTASARPDVPLVIVEDISETGTGDAGSPMAVDADKEGDGVDARNTADEPIGEAREQGQDINRAETPLQVQQTHLVPTPDVTTTPLRRSTRPRKSVTPNITPNPPESKSPGPLATPSSARTQVRKRLKSFEPNDEVVNDSQDEGEGARASPSPAPNVVRVRHRSPSKTPMSFRRELGSLSPTSSSVLAGLAFTPAESSGDNAGALPDQAESSNSQPVFSFSVFAPPSEAAGPSTPLRPTGPVRIASPTKVTTPAKFRIQALAPNDPTHTPARRIPIAEAIAQGQISPQKAVQLGYKPNGTALAPVPTPARRILVSEPSAPSILKSTPLRQASPVRGLPTRKGLSTQTVQKVVASVKGKEKASSLAQSSSSVIAELPYPLIPMSSGPSAASSSSAQGAQEAATSQSSPAKPGLKQVTSKIPRIGRKPYSRPAEPKVGEKPRSTTSRLVGQAKKSPPSTSATDPSGALSRRNTQAQPSKPSGSSTLRTKTNVQSGTTLLKRKREPDGISPAKPRVIMLRQAPSVSQSISELPKSVPAPAAPLPSKGSNANPGLVRFRRVIDSVPLLPSSSPSITPSQLTGREEEPTLPAIVCRPRSATPEPDLAHVQGDELSPGSPMKQDSSGLSHMPPEPTPAENSLAPTQAPIIVITEEPTVVEPPVMGLRRTTRSRRTTNMQNGSSEPLPRSSTSRRKPPAFQFDDVFSGMSMTALKDLTASNTVRNQHYLAAKLETEVIRKEGARPESPAVKIKTIVQREQDEKEKQRAERALRRARRSDEMNSSDIEGMLDVGYSSAAEDPASDDERGSKKHTRGAGDEEDYVTPDRPAFNIKPMRLFGDADMQDVEMQPKRRVKWDRGLFTTVYLDEVKLGSRQTLKENRSMKGILAPTAKALRLDTLGNLPHADSPLTDLIQENITVKKFVYDSDVAVAAPEIIVKNTRSKGRKK